MTHGHTRNYQQTPEYRAWTAMKTRCLNPNVKCYKWYGGRGIRIHTPWIDSFATFFAYVGRKPSPKHTLDRIDGNGDYCPGNVRWATQREQTSHTSQSRLITYRRQTLPITEWARRLNIPRERLAHRLNKGWTFARAISVPSARPKQITYQGETRTATAWARLYGFEPHIVLHRLQLGWSFKKAITTSVKHHKA